MRARNSGTAAAVAILLIGVAVAGAWMVVAPSIFGTSEPLLDGPLAESALAAPATPGLIEGVKVLSSFQVSQPRDPFRPLITEDSAPGGTGTGTDNGFEPSGIRVTLVEIRDVSGVLRATVKVDGTDYDVGVGDTFAGDFKVVSLDADSGVFLFGDNAFELAEGQEILK
ncbi:MAG: hypothetical protein OEM81_15200 [Acidimicrobiia bacterium]|nr:hypothetical protein [Acidimicrobiia bacterium]MDH3399154.1 hypothetical protein [Acidimicrobiia bacterium]MDH5616604.1 hypothetical protein [Acidimicrobiia bacterium]